MSLPGKLCIGILEEDNPLKSYFRFKPLLIEQGGCYQPYAEHDRYGDEGCIRIVPDKNESYHFKGRMRRMGLFCVVDLRAHPEENDKIRPNKNYRPGGPEVNACIIYSDVVREPAQDMIFEILNAQPDAHVPAPHTPSVLLRGEDVYPERYTWEAVEDGEGQARLIPGGGSCAPDSVQIFDLPGFRGETISFAIVPAGKLEPVAAPTRPEHAVEPHPAPERPEPVEAAPAEKAVEAPAREPAEPAEKPWLNHEPHASPEAPDPRLSVRQRILASQTGLNPRRGRSLQELVDEKWQRSRLSQMGNAASELETGMPVQSPVDAAVHAVRTAWAQPGLRGDLLSSLSAIEEFGVSLQECREAVRQRDIELRLDALEERRLALLRELDELNRTSGEVRARLKDEIRREEAGSLAEAVEKTKAARAEQQKSEDMAQAARAALADLQRTVDELTAEELERRLADFALDQRFAARLGMLRGEGEPRQPAPDRTAEAPAAITLQGLADRIAGRFAAEGIVLSRAEAANLCASLAAGSGLILSGPVGCGKTETARLLAEALGWPCALSCPDGDEPAALLLDDANTLPPDRVDWSLAASASPVRRILLTIQDAGAPVPAHALDRCFLIRLDARADAPWQPHVRMAAPAVPPASLAELLPADANLPAACLEGMDALRKGLAGCGAAFSARSLDEAWRYCAAMRALLGDEAKPEETLDLAVAQRLLPALLASAPLPALRKLPELLCNLPRSRALLDQPLPVEI